MNEQPILFKCENADLVGIVHHANAPSDTGVLIVVGGPQYRVGSHRQFVLLARYLAQNGVPVFRFDYRDMGDSSGIQTTFEQTQDDIKSAIDEFQRQVRSVNKVIIWGLCDAASAALYYAFRDARVSGLALLNPWVRTEEGEAKAYLKHYYIKRLFSIDFWRKIFSGKFNIKNSLSSLIELIRKSISSASSGKQKSSGEEQQKSIDWNLSLPDRMLQGLQYFQGNVLLILSGDSDYVALEFKDVVKASPEWQRQLQSSRITRKDYLEADHTFSTKAWRSQVEHWVLHWIKDFS